MFDAELVDRLLRRRHRRRRPGASRPPAALVLPLAFSRAASGIDFAAPRRRPSLRRRFGDHRTYRGCRQRGGFAHWFGNLGCVHAWPSRMIVITTAENPDPRAHYASGRGNAADGHRADPRRSSAGTARRDGVAAFDKRPHSTTPD